MKKLIKRFAALFAAGCVLASNGLMLTVSADDEPTGHWEYVKTVTYPEGGKVDYDSTFGGHYKSSLSFGGNTISFSQECTDEHYWG